jgi:hypothetical protein
VLKENQKNKKSEKIFQSGLIDTQGDFIGQ